MNNGDQLNRERDIEVSPDDSVAAPGDMVAAAPAEVSKVAGAAVEAGKGVASEAVAQVSTVVDQAKQQVSSVAAQTKDELSTQLDAKSRQAAVALQTLSGQLGALGAGRPDEAGPLPDLLDDVQRRVHTYARLLEEGGPQAVGQRLASFARRRPVRFLVSAGVAGFLAGRLARSGVSAAHDQAGSPADTPDRLRSGAAPREVTTGNATNQTNGAVDGYLDNPVSLGMP